MPNNVWRPPFRGDMIRQALNEAPSTAAELGAIFKWGRDERSSMRLASAWLSNLKHRGEARVIGQVKSAAGRMQNLYALQRRGVGQVFARKETGRR